MANKKKFPNVLGQLPKKPKFEKHYWVDYLELLCLTNIDGELSRTDALDKIRELAKDLKQGGEDEDSVGMIDKDEDISPAEKNDKWTELAEEWYRLLEYRKTVFKEYYPFSIISNGQVLKKHSKLYPKKKIYLSLLLSSALNYVEKYNKSYKNILSACFEIISFNAFKKCLPKDAETHIFGKNSIIKGKYGRGSLWKKLNKLSDDLNEELAIKKNHFAPTNTGDGGIDIVGWIPFNDDENSKIAFFGQCACTDDWVSKQFSTSYEKIKQLINMKAVSSNLSFIPFCFRDVNGNWPKPQDISCVLFDRQRLLSKIGNELNFFKKLESNTIVEEIIKQKEAVA